MKVESKVLAGAGGVAVFVPTTVWLLGLFGVAIDVDAALGLVVLIALIASFVGGWLWPSKTSTVSTGQRRAPDAGHGTLETVISVLVVVLLVVILLRVL